MTIQVIRNVYKKKQNKHFNLNLIHVEKLEKYKSFFVEVVDILNKLYVTLMVP